jgi:hypothetical protein
MKLVPITIEILIHNNLKITKPIGIIHNPKYNNAETKFYWKYYDLQ